MNKAPVSTVRRMDLSDDSDDDYDVSGIVIQEPDYLEYYFNQIAYLIDQLQHENITKVSYLYSLDGLEFNRRMVLYEISKLDDGVSFSTNFNKYIKYFKKTPQHVVYDNDKTKIQNKILDDLKKASPKNFELSLDKVNQLENTSSLSGNTTENFLKEYILNIPVYDGLEFQEKFEEKIQEMRTRFNDINIQVGSLEHYIDTVSDKFDHMTELDNIRKALDNIRKALLYKISVLFFDKEEDDIPQSYLHFLATYDSYFTEEPFHQNLAEKDTVFSIRKVQTFLRNLDNSSKSPQEIMNEFNSLFKLVHESKSLQNNFLKHEKYFTSATQVPRQRQGPPRSSRHISQMVKSGPLGSSSSSSPQRLTVFKSIKNDFSGMQTQDKVVTIILWILIIIVIIFVIRHFLISKKNRLKREKEEKTSTTTEINQEEAEVTTDLNEETEKKIEKEEEIKSSNNYVEYIINAILIGLFFYFLAMGMKNKKQIKKMSKKKKTK